MANIFKACSVTIFLALLAFGFVAITEPKPASNPAKHSEHFEKCANEFWSCVPETEIEHCFHAFKKCLQKVQ